MDLADTVINGRGSLDTHCSIDDLKATLAGVQVRLKSKQDRLEALLKENLDAFRWFDEQSRQLAHSYEQFVPEIETIQRLRGKPTVDIPALDLPTLPTREEFRAKILKERLIEATRRLAFEKDFEMNQSVLDGITWNGHKMAFALTVSRKVSKLVGSIDGQPIDLAAEVVNLFLVLQHQIFKDHLVQVPHFGALFYNDTQFLIYYLKTRHTSVPVALVQAWNKLGSQVLDSHVKKQSQELQAILQIDGDNIERVAAQALLRISQIGKVWAPILDKIIFASSMLVFEGIVLEWFWSYLSGLDYITEETIQLSKRLANSIVRQQDTRDALSDLRTKLRAFVEAMDMSLMQLTNRIRRGQYEGVLSPQECYSLVEALFEDTPSREACLEEIAEDF